MTCCAITHQQKATKAGLGVLRPYKTSSSFANGTHTRSAWSTSRLLVDGSCLWQEHTSDSADNIFIEGTRLPCNPQDYQERRAIRTELKGLAKEERQRQERAVKEVLGRAAVVCSTLSGIGVRMLHGATFDVAVIDEAAQVGVHKSADQ